jgi:TPR repeat protein
MRALTKCVIPLAACLMLNACAPEGKILTDTHSKVVEQGYAEAQLNLGRMYYNGDGVPKDYVEGYARTIVGIENGPLKATDQAKLKQNLIQQAQQKMTISQIVAAQQRAKEIQAEFKPNVVEQGNVAAQPNLSLEATRLAQDERRKAADLYMLYTRTADIQEKKRLLLNSRRILKDILVKYPSVEIAPKVAGNIARVEQEIRSLDPNLLHTPADQEQENDVFGTTMKERVLESSPQASVQQAESQKSGNTGKKQKLPGKNKQVVGTARMAKSKKQPADQLTQEDKEYDAIFSTGNKEIQRKQEDSAKDQKMRREQEDPLKALDTLYHADEDRRREQAESRALEF